MYHQEDWKLIHLLVYVSLIFCLDELALQHEYELILSGQLVGWLVVFNVPSTARSFRDGTPIYCPLRRT